MSYEILEFNFPLSIGKPNFARWENLLSKIRENKENVVLLVTFYYGQKEKLYFANGYTPHYEDEITNPGLFWFSKLSDEDKAEAIFDLDLICGSNF